MNYSNKVVCVLHKTIRILVIIVVILITLFHGMNVSAETASSFAVITEYDVAEKYNISIHDACAGHTSFTYVTFNEEGWFAIFCSASEKESAGTDPAASLYIDIYNEEGVFQKEISFEYRSGFACELTGQVLQMYFYNDMICCDLQTGAIQGYHISENYAEQKGSVFEIRKITFEMDGWQYKCGRSLLGYTSIIRTKGNQTETLLKLSGNVPGSNLSFWAFMIRSGVGALAAGFLIKYLWKKLRANRSDN